MRLIEFQNEMLLASDGRLIRISSPKLVDMLMERLLLVFPQTMGEACVPVEDVRSYSREGDHVTIEAFSNGAPRLPVAVGRFLPQVFVNLVSGFYPDNWAANAFTVEVVNGYTNPSSVQLDFFLPPPGQGQEDGKSLTLETDGETRGLDLVRGGIQSLHLDVAETTSLSFLTEAEPVLPPDMRSRGCVVSAIRSSQDRRMDIFAYRTYFTP